jgi:hypothetical protein
MMMNLMMTGTGLALMMTVTVGAQTRPDFSGRWVPAAANRVEGTPGLEALEPAVEEITQTSATVTVTRRWGVRVLAQQHVPDGVRRDESDHPGGPAQSRTWWDGDQLITECVQTLALPGAERTVTTREARRLDAGQMVVDLTWTSGAGSVTRRTVYRRAQ